MKKQKRGFNWVKLLVLLMLLNEVASYWATAITYKHDLAPMVWALSAAVLYLVALVLVFKTWRRP